MHKYWQSASCSSYMSLYCLFSFISFNLIAFAITARLALKLQIADSTAFITSYKLRGASENEHTHTHSLTHARKVTGAWALCRQSTRLYVVHSHTRRRRLKLKPETETETEPTPLTLSQAERAQADSGKPSEIQHTGLLLLCVKFTTPLRSACQRANFCAVLCTATSGARLQYDRGFRLRPTCVRIYATATVELILFHRSTKSKKPVVCSVANAATLSSLPACCLRVACIKLCVDVGCIFSTYYFPRHTMANATATATTTTLPPQPQPLPHKKLTYHTLPLQCTEPHTHAQTLTHAHHTYLTFRIAFPWTCNKYSKFALEHFRSDVYVRSVACFRQIFFLNFLSTCVCANCCYCRCSCSFLVIVVVVIIVVGGGDSAFGYCTVLRASAASPRDSIETERPTKTTKPTLSILLGLFLYYFSASKLHTLFAYA